MSVALSRLEVRKFRSIFDEKISVDLRTGVNAFTGPNNVGKSNIMRAIALAARDDFVGVDDDLVFDPDRDMPQQVAWAWPSVTLEFDVQPQSSPERTLLKYAEEYEQSIDGGGNTFASEGRVRLRVKYQQGQRQEFIQGKAGDRRGNEKLNAKVLRQLRNCVRFVMIRSGEDLQQFLSGRFRQVLHSVLRERLKDELQAADERRKEYVAGLRDGLLADLGESMLAEFDDLVPEIDAVELVPWVPAVEDTIAVSTVHLSGGATTELARKGTGVRGAVLVGMLRYLAEHGKRNLVCIVEEPESFLHPGAQEELREHLESMTTNRNVTLITTTHSPFLLPTTPESSIFAVRKRDGATYIADECTGAAPARHQITGLFRDAVVPRLLDSIDAIPRNAKAVLVVEGSTDRDFLKLTAERHDRSLKGLHILPGTGVDSATVEAILAANRGYHTVALFDHDEPGRNAAKRLSSKYGFDGRDVFSYHKFANAGAEAEDLLPLELLQAFVEEYGEDLVVKRKEKRGKHWRYDFGKVGKELLPAFIRANASRDDLAKFAELLDSVLARVGLGP